MEVRIWTACKIIHHRALTN